MSSSAVYYTWPVRSHIAAWMQQGGPAPPFREGATHYGWLDLGSRIGGLFFLASHLRGEGCDPWDRGYLKGAKGSNRFREEPEFSICRGERSRAVLFLLGAPARLELAVAENRD